LVSAITDLGAEKINVFDVVEITREAGFWPGIIPRLWLLLGTTGGLCGHGDFVFLGESLSPSVSHRLFNGLLLLLFRSNTSSGIGLGSGDIFFAVIISDLEEERTGAWGLMASPKLNTGRESAVSCVELSVGEGRAGGQGALDSRSALVAPWVLVTLDFILRLDLVEFTIALSVETSDSSPD